MGNSPGVHRMHRVHGMSGNATVSVEVNAWSEAEHLQISTSVSRNGRQTSEQQFPPGSHLLRVRVDPQRPCSCPASSTSCSSSHRRGRHRRGRFQASACISATIEKSAMKKGLSQLLPAAYSANLLSREKTLAFSSFFIIASKSLSGWKYQQRTRR